METWLTYLAAFLMAGATAYTFSSSTPLLKMMSAATSFLTGVAALLFLVVSFVTIASGTASLRKNRLGGRTVRITIFWAVVTTLILSMLGVILANGIPQIFPVSSSAGGNYTEVLSSFTSSIRALDAGSIIGKFFLPLVFAAFILGAALTPSSDVIRPAYTVMNSFSEAIYRIQRTAAYFGAFYVYVAGTAFFLNIWQEKTAFVSPKPFVALALSVLLVIMVVLPLLYAIFTGFRKNPYGVVGRGLAGLLTAFLSSNIYASSLMGESLSRSNMGIQKRISSTATPLSILIARGGTAFVSTLTTVTLLKTLGAEISTFALVILALTISGLSLVSSFFPGVEIAVVSVFAIRFLNINVYGAEAAIVALLPILNGFAIMIDVLISFMASAIVGARTKTDAKIPLKDTI